MDTINLKLDAFKGLEEAAEMYDWISELIHVLWEREAEYIATCDDIQTGCCSEREEDEDPAAVLENLRMSYNLTAAQIAERAWPIRQISAILKEVYLLLKIVKVARKIQLPQETAATPQPAPVPSEAEAAAVGDVMQALHTQMDAIRAHGKMIDQALTAIEERQKAEARDRYIEAAIEKHEKDQNPS